MTNPVVKHVAKRETDTVASSVYQKDPQKNASNNFYFGPGPASPHHGTFHQFQPMTVRCLM